MADLLVRSTVEDVDQWLQSEDNYNANIDNLLRVISRGLGVLEESMLTSRRVSRVGLIMAEANSATRPIKRLFLIERLY